MEVWAGIEPAYTRFAGAAVTVPVTTPVLGSGRRIRTFGLPSQSRLLFHLSYSATVGIGRRGSHPVVSSILEGIEYVGTGHHHRERPQRVLDLDRALMASQDLGKSAVGLRRLIEVGAVKHHAARA
jgi:hypothetical protein